LLGQRAPECNAFGESLKEIARDLFDTVAAAAGVMASAPQIAERARLIYIAKQVAGEALFVANPVMIEHGALLQHHKESCMSCPGITIDIQRYASIVVVGRNTSGGEITVRADGALAQAIQHELNHLEGKTIIECAKRAKRWFYREKMRKYGGHKGNVLEYGNAPLVGL
jgi:peptide deformylase